MEIGVTLDAGMRPAAIVLYENELKTAWYGAWYVFIRHNVSRTRLGTSKALLLPCPEDFGEKMCPGFV